MTTKPKPRRFRLRLGDDGPTRGTPPGPINPQANAQPGQQPAGAPPTPLARRAPTPADADSLFDEGAAPATPPTPAQAAPRTATAPAHNADTALSASADAEIEAIRNENLSGRQLRMAMRVAQKNGIKATTGLEAVRMLRRQGIDPFETSTLLEIVRNEGEKGRALVKADEPQLPKAHRQPSPPAPVVAPNADASERQQQVSRIQREIVRRRRRRMVVLASRLLVFVGLPTLLAAWYFYFVATPLYATYSEFTIQQADATPSASAGGLMGALGGAAALGGFHESNAVQSYLQSREAMRRLNAEEGFKAYFQQPNIDPLRRLPADVTDEGTFRLYEDMVQVSYDPTEGIIRMEVIAADPETSERFARSLVAYAEEQVDQLTARLRDNQLRDSIQSVQDAEDRFRAAQQQVLDLQERFQVLSSEVEVQIVSQQITNLESQLNQERLGLADLLSNPRPNNARLEQARRRIDALETQVAELRGQLTTGGADGTSLARVQRELVMAQSDVATRQMLLAQAMQQLELARIEANRQVRYLALSVSPIAPDEATYPRAFENTALAFLIFSGLYLMLSMTTAILREQVTG